MAATALVPLPAQPDGVPWPTEEWPEGALPAGVVLEPLVDEAFDPARPIAPTFSVKHYDPAKDF